MSSNLRECTGVDATEHVELEELAVDGGEERFFDVLRGRYPVREVADGVGDAPKTEKGELPSACAGRVRTIFMQAQRGGAELPDAASVFSCSEVSSRWGPTRGRLGGQRAAVGRGRARHGAEDRVPEGAARARRPHGR
ncbi:unnamed protein product [Prorocentrum cordatum]|uniref:Uncharacterized protein n=1 Tax=Prorocentrum cordatum TaxID=2364126 RepID=A0ABN9XQL3_9DINO|nr:unnamed protein product [Polarella glacialis]